MKRFILPIILLASITSCSNSNYQFQNDCYKVYKIKRNNDWYEIYTKQGQQHFKIVSQKDTTNTKGTKIKCGRCYKFEIKSGSELLGETLGVTIMPSDRLGAVGVSETTAIKVDGGKIRELYYADNLKGLYLTK